MGNGLFKKVPNGIKAGDQSVTGKKTREAIMFLTNVQFDLEGKMETSEEGSVFITLAALIRHDLNEDWS